MRSKAAVAGHPLHSMLVPFPFAFLTGAAAFDIAGVLIQLPSWWTTAGYLTIAGIGTALLAALAGAVDYVYTVPPRSSAKSRATRHMLTNLTAVALFAMAWWIRGGPAVRPGAIVLALEAIGLGLLGAGAFMGGTLVTRNLIGIDHRYARAGRWIDQAIDQKSNGAPIVAQAGELEIDQMKLLRIRGHRIVLARTRDGYVAFDDRCSHRGGSLAGGVMVCGTVQCLWHGSQFDAATGKVTAGPAREPIRVYRVTEDAGNVRLVF